MLVSTFICTVYDLKSFLFWPIKETHPTFSIILRVSCCCSQCVEVSTRLLIPVMQTHAAELWLPKQSRLRTCKKKKKKTQLATSIFSDVLSLHES